MRRLMTLISTLVLVLVLWTGTAAHAAETLGCGEEITEAAGHFEGDGDEVPADPDNPEPHHHGVCHGHCAGIPTGAASPLGAEHVSGPTIGLQANFHSGTPPDSALRPPIA